jgi:hypothetical protein
MQENDENYRLRREAQFRTSLAVWEYGGLVAAIVLTALYQRVDPGRTIVPFGRLILIGITFALAALVWQKLFRSQDAAWRQSAIYPNHPSSTTPILRGLFRGRDAASMQSMAKKPLDFAQFRGSQIWIASDLDQGINALIAIALGFCVSKFMGAAPLLPFRIAGFLHMDVVSAAHFIFFLLICSIFISTVFGYMRNRLDWIRQFLMRDREPEQKDSDIMSLKRMNFSEYSHPATGRSEESGSKPMDPSDS